MLQERNIVKIGKKVCGSWCKHFRRSVICLNFGIHSFSMINAKSGYCVWSSECICFLFLLYIFMYIFFLVCCLSIRTKWMVPSSEINERLGHEVLSERLGSRQMIDGSYWGIRPELGKGCLAFFVTIPKEYKWPLVFFFFVKFCNSVIYWSTWKSIDGDVN